MISAACTKAPADTAEETDVVTTDTDVTDTDTAPTTTPLPAEMSVSGVWEGTPFAFGCAGADGDRLTRRWGEALGDITGAFACADEAGSSLGVTFLDAATGEWSAPATADFTYSHAGGGTLNWYASTASSWSLVFEDVTWADAETLAITGTLAGAWAEGSIGATFSLQLPCSTCP